MSNDTLGNVNDARIIVQLAELDSPEDVEQRLQDFLAPYAAEGRTADGWSQLVDAALDLGRVNVGAVFAKQYAASDPQNIQAQYNVGLINLWAGRQAEAEDAANRLVEQYPEHDDGYQLMLDILQMSGRWEEMPVWWKKLYEREQSRLEAHPLGREGIRFLNQNHGIVHRFGETATQLDPLVKMVELDWREAGRLRLLAPTDLTANAAYLDYWRKNIDIVSDPAAINELIDLATELRIHTRFFRLPDGRFVSKMQGQAAVQQAWQEAKRPPLLKLRHDHRARGRSAMAKLGLPEDAWFACLHVREPGYLRPHEAEIHAFRDADIGDYMLAAEAITRRGGWVVRLGDATMRPLDKMERVIDYALSDAKADWLDVYLLGAARFVLGTTSGPTPVAATFGTPVIMTNMVPHGERGPNQRSLFLPKLYRRKGGEFLSFRDMMAGPRRWLWNGRLLGAEGLEAVDNSPEELRDVTEEMMDRLGDGVPENEDQAALQTAYRALFDRDDDFDTGSRIGGAFIEKYRGLL